MICGPRKLPSRQAKFLNARMGRSKLLDGHIEKGLILSGLLFADAHAPFVEILIPFEEQNDVGIVGDLVGKFRMLPQIPIKLHPQQAVSCFEDNRGLSFFIGRVLPWSRS